MKIPLFEITTIIIFISMSLYSVSDEQLPPLEKEDVKASLARIKERYQKEDPAALARYFPNG